MTEPDEPELAPESLGTAPGRGRLVGRRVVVVGAGTRPSEEPDPPPGNGRAIAVLAAREGARVACVDRDEAAAKQTVAIIEAEGGWARALRADVTDEAQCAALVTDLARQTAREAAPRRSRANVLIPGYVDTPMGRAASARNPSRARRLPLGRQATAWEVAYAAIWLLSHESSYMTAQSLVLDGGITGLP